VAKRASPMDYHHLEEADATDEKAEIVAHGQGAWDFDAKRGGLKSMTFKEGVHVGSPRGNASSHGGFFPQERVGNELRNSWEQALHGADSGNASGNASSPGMLSELNVDIDLDIEVHQAASQPMVPSKVFSHASLLQRSGTQQRVVLSYPTRSMARSSSNEPSHARNSASSPTGRFQVPRQAYSDMLEAGTDDYRKLARDFNRLAGEDIGGPRALVELLQEVSSAELPLEGSSMHRRLALLKALSVPHGQQDVHGQEQTLAQVAESASASEKERYAAVEALLRLHSPGRATQRVLENLAFVAADKLHPSALDDDLRNRAVLGLGVVAPRSPEIFASSVEHLVRSGERILLRYSAEGRWGAPMELVLAALENAYPAWGKAAQSSDEASQRVHERAVAFVREALVVRMQRANAKPGTVVRLWQKMGFEAPQPQRSLAQRNVVTNQHLGDNTNSSQCVNFEHRYENKLANFTIGGNAFVADFNGDFKTFAVMSASADLSVGARLHTPLSLDIWDGAFQADVMDLDVQAYFHSVTLKEDGYVDCGGLDDASVDVEGGCAPIDVILRERSSCVELGGNLQLMGENIWNSFTRKSLGNFSMASALDSAERTIEGESDAPKRDGRWERVIQGGQVSVSLWIVSVALRFNAGATLSMSGASTVVAPTLDPNASTFSMDSVVSWRPTAEAYGTIGVGLGVAGLEVSVDGQIFFLSGGLPAKAQASSSDSPLGDVRSSLSLTGNMTNLNGAINLAVKFLWAEVYRAPIFKWDGPASTDWILWPNPPRTHLGDISAADDLDSEWPVQNLGEQCWDACAGGGARRRRVGSTSDGPGDGNDISGSGWCDFCGPGGACCRSRHGRLPECGGEGGFFVHYCYRANSTELKKLKENAA